LRKNEFNINNFVKNLLEIKNSKGELVVCPGEENHIYKDFDDVVPFLLYFNQSKEIKKQILLSRRYINNGFIEYGSYLFSWRMDEYIGGLIFYYQNTKDKDVLDIIEEQEHFLNKLFELHYIPGYFYIPKGKFTDLSFSRGYGLIEVCLENDMFKKETKLNALRILNNFLNNNKFFRKESLFLNKYKYQNKEFKAYITPLFIDKINFIKGTSTYFGRSKLKNTVLRSLQNSSISRVKLMKDNSNLIYSVIEAYKYTKKNIYKNVLKKWIYEGVLTKMYNQDGFVHTYWENKPYGISLAQNFTFIDILMDYYHNVYQDNNLLEIVEKITKFWLNKKMPNGLIPENPNENIDFLDCQTDFSVCLKKLSYLTGNYYYQKKGRQLFHSIILNHYKNGYLVNKVDDKGNTIDKTINLKYNILFLKAYIAYNSNLNIFNDLFKDR